MNEVRLSTEKYDALQRFIQAKAARIDALEAEIAKLKSDHETELEELAKKEKVRIIKKPYSVMEMIMRRDNSLCPQYVGFVDVKKQVEEDFKKGLFDKELEQYKQEQFGGLLKKIVEKNSSIDNLKAEIERMKKRSLWERIRNK